MTICTKYRIHWFGRVVAGEMILSDEGSIIANEWQRTEQIRPDVGLDAWQVMPDHLHGIVVIRDVPPALRAGGGNYQNTFGPQSRNLASIIRGFKSAATNRIRSGGQKAFGWQPLYHDHIIRDYRALMNIRQYIINNPRNWSKEHPMID